MDVGDRHPVVGVVGGSGGVGASSLATVLALEGAAMTGRSVLVDVDAVGGGIDVLLGLEHEPGARWSGLRLDGGHLEPESLVAGLPGLGDCAVLAADDGRPDPEALRQLVGVASAGGAGSAGGIVVLDLPRGPCPEREAALDQCDLLVVLARGDVTGLVAARAVVTSLPDSTGPVGAIGGPSASATEHRGAGLVVRQGEVQAADAASLVGLGLLGELPSGGAVGGFDVRRPPTGFVTFARGLLAGVLSAADHSRISRREPAWPPPLRAVAAGAETTGW